MTVTVSRHAVDRYRERVPAHARWWDAEIAARIAWLASRAVEVGNARNGGRYLSAGGVTLVVRNRRVLTVQLDGWWLRGNRGRHVGRLPKGMRTARTARRPRSPEPA